MKNTKPGRLLAALLLTLWSLPQMSGQGQPSDPACYSSTVGGVIPSTAFVNYGNSNKMKSTTRRMRVTIGQPVVGTVTGDDNNGGFGFWTSSLVPPLPPAVKATQGELLDRIQISWTPNPLGAFPIGGYKIYRDSVFIAQVDKNTYNYNDYNVIAGKNYLYEVRGANLFGEGSPGRALGFQVPNGVVTGWVRTLNGSPVPGAQVSLSPLQGYSVRFGQFDGAKSTAATATGGHFLPTTAAGNWSLTFWVKTAYNGGGSAILGVGGALLFLPTASGISVYSNATILSGDFPSGSASDWHNVALTFGNGQFRLYLDGKLVSLQEGDYLAVSDELNCGALPGQVNFWEGQMDELRIYHRRLDELELAEVQSGTASSLTPDLKYYWKMDEGAGTKSFDLLRRTKLFFCGAVFDADRPAVPTAGMTNADGYYRIESANYGTGTTFLATPKKDFYKHRALKFLPSENDRATLPDFSLTDKATLETWVNQSEPQGTQTILYKKWGVNSFALQVEAGVLRADLNGTTQYLDILGIGYHHLALTISKNPGSTQIEFFKDGSPLGSLPFPPILGDWSDPAQNWVLGASPAAAGSFTDFFNGLIDEVAVYDTTLSQAKIQSHFQNARDAQEQGLRIYFPLDEGTGNILTHAGSVLIEETGLVQGAEWTVLANFQETMPHVFSPATRQVTLNPSVTSVDQVDFTDRSTVAVSGFVRYPGTDCFAEKIEILVNGESYNPIILTDSTGKFVIDLDPGATVELRPKFEDHLFTPASVQVTNVIAPLAGIVFNDLTVREINGRVAGGDCKKSIISDPGTPTGTVCTVKVSTTDGCFEKQVTIDNFEGEYEFQNLPPLKFTVAVIEHSDPAIKTAFQVLGGVEVDLSEKPDTAVDFTYYAPPEIEVNGLDLYSPTCPLAVLEQHSTRTINIKVKETYYNNEVCYLDTAAIKLVNGFEDSVRLLTLASAAGLNHTFKVGAPIASPPFLKTLQVVATTIKGDETGLVVQALITGIRNKQNTFTTEIPTEPTLVLHDPPGDGSSAFFEEGQKICKNMQLTLEGEVGAVIGLKTFLGAETLTLLAPGGIGSLFDVDVENTLGFEAYNAFQKVNDSTYQTCTSFNRRISTSDGDLVVGAQGGDVFVGSGFNLEFGFADLVELDTNNCAGMVSTVLNVQPDTFSTSYIYSEWGIRNNVIRYLDSLRINPGTSPSDSLRYAQSIALWNKVLDDNQKRKDTMTVRQNISFDAGATYEYSETSDTTGGSTTGEAFHGEGETGVEYGFALNEFGFVGKIGLKYSTTKGKANGSETEKGITTGYTLADDDIADAFSVEVGIDSKYKTAIFRTRTGQSSCPWEPGTAHREGNSMQFRNGSGAVALDVPANEPAVFLFTLGNNSETNETFTYALTAGPESNPHGAKLAINGAPMDLPVMYAVPYGTSIPITITLERGPIEYDYDSLEVVFYSLCEDQRANALGILPDDDKILYSAQYISAHFIKPCSEVEISVPEQDWVIFPDPNTPGDDNLMRITVSGYNKQNTDFEKIRVQYRRSDGDGAWINIVAPASGGNPDQDNTGAIERDKLGNVYTHFYWKTDGLADGNYEIRAVSICSGNVADRPGFSKIIKGRIQRQPPGLLGVPQPSDGVYQVGDEVSFTFDEDINCDKINPLDNVKLFDATTGLPVDIDITCKGNKIIIDPNFQNALLENHILRAELHDIEDLVGNRLVFEKWEFYVDRNELAWLIDSSGVTKFSDENKTFTAKVHNQGGYPTQFVIQGLPTWVANVTPNTATLMPNEIREITFSVDSSMAMGDFDSTATLHTLPGVNPFFMGGDEALKIGVRNICRPPNWTVNPAQFEQTMNMVLRLKVNNAFPTDPEDRVAVFIGGQLRGMAKPQFVASLDMWLVYLTVYGNTADANKPLAFEIFTASECLRYPGALASTFVANSAVGSSASPTILPNNSTLIRDIPLEKGWNWISLNLSLPSPPSPTKVLANLPSPKNDLIKSQTLFATYDTLAVAWTGSLTSMNNRSAYLYKAAQANTLKITGNPLTAASVPIPVTAGWNWIGYPPNYTLPVNAALASITAQAGDIIKSQTAFAQYLNSTSGWIGNLTKMQPPKGYQLKVATGSTLTYPPNFTDGGPADDRGDDPVSQFWTVDETKFEFSSTMIAMLAIDSANATSATMELGAFVGNEVRGAATAIYIETLHSYVFFLTTFSNLNGETISYKLYDSGTGLVADLRETTLFAGNEHSGSIDQPVPFNLQSTGISEATGGGQSLEVRPNPFHGSTAFLFQLDQEQELELIVTDAGGRTVSVMRQLGSPGLNSVDWEARSTSGAMLPAGVYFVRLRTGAGCTVRKLVLQ